MSTAIQGDTFLRSSDALGSETNERLAFYPPAENFGRGPQTEIRYAPVKRSSSHSDSKQKSIVLRRISGFLTEMQGKNARVTFVESGQTFQYDMPADQLRKSGIEIINQPFQMDEIEIQSDDGLIVGYRFRPLAKASDAYVETLNFDDERKRKRDLILKKFAKTKA